jgi:proline dehydrogenase
MGLARHLLLWASQNQWLGRQIQTRAFARRASRRFLPGEDLESALTAAAALQANGMGTLITLLGENVTSAKEAESVAREYSAVQAEIAQRGIDCQLSVKPTQLGMDLDIEVCVQQLGSMLRETSSADNLVWIDMESSAYVDRTLDLVERVSQPHNNIGLCLQACLHRTRDDLERLIRLGVPVRLVKGAYKEPAPVAIRKKSNVDENFFVLAARMLDAASGSEGGFPTFGTHDMSLIARIQETARGIGLQKSSYEFAMLYGIGRENQELLAQDGYLVRVLVSYGSAWFPWYMRRLAERPANVWLVVRSVFSG